MLKAIFELISIKQQINGGFMCNCLEEVGNKVNQHLVESAPDGAKFQGGLDSGWQNEFLSFSGAIGLYMRYELPYFKRKKDGSFAKNVTHNGVNVTMSYCPFCGEKQERAL